MEVIKISESGFYEALFGIGLSYGITSGESLVEFKRNLDYEGTVFNGERSGELFKQLYNIALELKDKNGGENKFLRQMIMTLDITAPRFWWTEFDTYKVGTVAQSESTMHTITRRHLVRNDFERSEGIDYTDIINKINDAIDVYKKEKNKETKKKIWRGIISLLPQSFLQRRIVTLNYAVLRNIIEHRRNHKLQEWKYFIDSVIAQANYTNFLRIEKEG